MRNAIQWYENSIFSKNYEKLPSGFAPRPPSVTRFDLQYTSLFNTSPTLNIFTFQLLILSAPPPPPPPLNEFVVTCQHQATASDLPFYDIFVPTKNFFSKFLMTSLHVICGLGPLNQKSWLRLWRAPHLISTGVPPFLRPSLMMTHVSIQLLSSICRRGKNTNENSYRLQFLWTLA